MKIRRCLRHRDERGAAAVEFALIAPLLFMLIFGIISFGLAWSEKNVFVGAAREGARYAAVRCAPDATACTDQLIKDRITTASAGYPVDLSSFKVIPAQCTNATVGAPVTVQWTQPIKVTVPFIPINLNVSIRAVFRCE